NLKVLYDDLASTTVTPASYAFTLSAGRKVHHVRIGFHASNLPTLRSKIEQVLTSRNIGSVAKKFNKIFYIFPEAENISTDLVTQARISSGSFRRIYDSFKINKKDADARFFAFHYALYKTLRELGFTPSNFFGLGMGKFVAEAIDNNWSIQKCKQEIKKFVITPEQNLRARATKLISSLDKNGNILFFEPAFSGGLHSIMRDLTVDRNVMFESLESTSHNWFMAMVERLFEQVEEVTGKGLFSSTQPRAELPLYSFEPTRCWLRTESNVLRIGEQLLNEGVITPDKTQDVDLSGLITRIVLDIVREIMPGTKVTAYDNFFEIGG
ncbi:MAG: hypothetical protein ACKO96_47875, partial [Flammeovirgaceae bacterium]